MLASQNFQPVPAMLPVAEVVDDDGLGSVASGFDAGRYGVLVREALDQSPGRLDEQEIAVCMAKEAVGVKIRAELGHVGLDERAVGIDGPVGGKGVEGKPGDYDPVVGSLLADRGAVLKGTAWRGEALHGGLGGWGV